MPCAFHELYGGKLDVMGLQRQDVLLRSDSKAFLNLLRDSQ